MIKIHDYEQLANALNELHKTDATFNQKHAVIEELYELNRMQEHDHKWENFGAAYHMHMTQTVSVVMSRLKHLNKWDNGTIDTKKELQNEIANATGIILNLCNQMRQYGIF